MRTVKRNSETWLNQLSEGTKRVYRNAFNKFLNYIEMTEEELIKNRIEDVEEDTGLWENKVVQFRKWLKTQPKEKTKNKEKKLMSDHYSKTMANAIRGYFTHLKMPLSFDRGQRTKMNKARNGTRDFPLQREHLARLTEVADVRERYIVMVGKSFGLRIGDFMKLKRGMFTPVIDQESPISIGETYTDKEDVKAFPFIDTDAKTAIKALLKVIDDDPKTPMLDIEKRQLNRIIQDLFKKAKIDTGTYRIRFHMFRKFLIDRLKNIMSESAWKQIVGKKISEGAYVSTHGLRVEYAKAMEYTCVKPSENRESLRMLRDRIDQYERIVGQQAIDIEGLKEKIETLDKTVQTLMETIDLEDRKKEG